MLKLGSPTPFPPKEGSHHHLKSNLEVNKQKMRKCYLTIFCCLSLGSCQNVEEDLSIVKCARRGKIWNQEDQKCYEPHSREPCSSGEQIFVLDTATRVGKCIDYPSTCPEEHIWNGRSCIDVSLIWVLQFELDI